MLIACCWITIELLKPGNLYKKSQNADIYQRVWRRNLFRYNHLSTISADALAPCVTRSSANTMTKQDNLSIVSSVYEKSMFIFRNDSNTNLFLYFPSWIR